MTDRVAWMDDAECVGLDTNLFFPEPGDNSSLVEAKLVCDRCPVRATCETHFIAEEHGIFGGRTPGERSDIRNGRNRPYKPPRSVICPKCYVEFFTVDDQQLRCNNEVCRADRSREYQREYQRKRDLARMRARLAANRDAPMRGTV